MTRKEIKVIALCSAGQIIEYYDFLLFVFLAGIISSNYFTGSIYARYLELFGVFALGYFVRPIGGVIFGHFGDRYGRKNSFFIALILISLATLCIGLVPTYHKWGIISPIILICLRLIQGISLGGEMPGAATFIYESMPKGKKIFGTSFVFAGLNLGSFLGSLIVAIISSIFVSDAILSQSIAWRIPFIIGGIAGIVIAIFRQELMETPIFERLLNTSQVLRFPIVELFKKDWRNLIKGIMLYLITLPGTIILITFPTFLTSYLHYYTNTTIYFINSGNILILILLIILYSYFIQKYYISIYKFFFTASMLMAISVYPIFYLMLSKNILLLSLGYFTYSVIGAMLTAALIPIIVSLFPPVIRYSATGTSMNLSAVISTGLVPLITTVFIQNSGGSFIGLAIFVAVICLICAGFGFLLYKRPPDRVRMLALNKEIRSFYKQINELSTNDEIKQEIRNNLEKTVLTPLKTEIDSDTLKYRKIVAVHDDTKFLVSYYRKRLVYAKNIVEFDAINRLMVKELKFVSAHNPRYTEEERAAKLEEYKIYFEEKLAQNPNRKEIEKSWLEGQKKARAAHDEKYGKQS